jgi:hypothetical protein
MIMKYLLFYFLILIFNMNSFCQKRAVITNSGKEVDLFDDGTWKYVSSDSAVTTKSDTIIVNKSKDSNFLIESTKLKYGIWINKNKWLYTKSQSADADEPSEYSFTLKGEDAYGMIIAERIEIPIDNLIEIAFQNAQSVASDIKIVKQECRKVNGTLVHFMQMEGTIKGVKFVYLSYYYSDSNGSIQFITYTSLNLLKQYIKDMEMLLNGFIIKTK